jgi:hypothetical protein
MHVRRRGWELLGEQPNTHFYRDRIILYHTHALNPTILCYDAGNHDQFRSAWAFPLLPNLDSVVVATAALAILSPPRHEDTKKAIVAATAALAILSPPSHQGTKRVAEVGAVCPPLRFFFGKCQ